MMGTMQELWPLHMMAQPARPHDAVTETPAKRLPRHILLELEVEKHTSSETVTQEAIAAAENDGIIFVDEIDKICTP